MRIVICLSIAIGLSLPLRAAEFDQPHNPKGAALADLAVEGLPAPLRVRLVVSRNGVPWNDYFRSSHERHVRTLFDQLDGDRDGQLSNREALRMPAPGTFIERSEASDVHVAFNFRVLDADGDGGASRDELAEYLGGFTRIPLRFQIEQERSRRSGGNLFDVLDTDHDGVLNAKEWSNLDAIRARDRDGDRVITGDELNEPIAALFGPEFVAAPWHGSTRTTLSFRLEEPAASPADLTIVVRYLDSASQDQRASVSAIVNDPANKRKLKLLESNETAIVLEVDGRRIEFGLIPAPFRRSEQLRLAILRQFDAVAQKSGGEIPPDSDLPPMVNSIYSLADRNGDGQLTRPELVECLDSVIAAETSSQASRLRLTVFPERQGLDSLIDTNLDRRLSLRELSAMPTLLSGFARRDGTIQRDSFPSTVRILLQRGPLTEMTGSDVLLNSGPPWFFRADRNRDGDLDELEFLGSAEMFRKIDLNGDGWIDLREAVSADRQLHDRATKEPSP